MSIKRKPNIMKSIKQSENVCKNFIAFSKKIGMAITLLLLFMSVQSKASVQLMVVGASNVSSINTGNQFIYTLNYQISSLTTNGQNVVATMALPQNLEPFDVSNFSNSVSFSASQVSSVTYNPVTNTITVTFVNPIPAGSTGQLQVKFKYINGTTPNNYAPDLKTSIDAANNVNSPDTSTGPVFSNIINVAAVAANNFNVGKVLSSGGAINDISIFKINIGSSSSSSGALVLNNPTIVDTLPIGTTYQVLTADTTVSPYKVKWATPAGGGGKVLQVLNLSLDAPATTSSATPSSTGLSLSITPSSATSKILIFTY
jgi:hypothetical protein